MWIQVFLLFGAGCSGSEPPAPATPAAPAAPAAEADPQAQRAAIQTAFSLFVTLPDSQAAGVPTLAGDATLLEATSQKVRSYAKMRQYWAGLDRVRDDWAYVLGAVRKQGLPDVIAAAPFQGSGYTAQAQSPRCEDGWWQLLPETALQAGLQVAGCRIEGAAELWTPTAAPPGPNAPYLSGGKCRIQGDCQVDERKDLARSTEGALRLLGASYQDPALRASGTVVEQTLTRLVGLSGAEAQQYLANVAAHQILAACYFGSNYAQQEAFASYASLQDGYCKALSVPSAGEVTAPKGGTP